MKKNLKKLIAATFIKALSCAFTISPLVHTTIANANESPLSVQLFDDVKDSNKFFYNPVYWASSKKITTGFNNNTFRPDDTCTRGQAVTFLWRYENEPVPETEYYLSDTINSSFKDSISWALSTRVTTGFNDGTFRQDNPCTRGQIVTFIWRDAGRPQVETSNPFSDVSETSVFSDAIIWAVDNGITTGFEDNTFRQDDPCTRGQLITFLYRWNSFKEKGNTDTQSITKHQHNWQPVYKTVHHDAVTHQEEKRTPTKSLFDYTNAIQIYGNLGGVSPAFYQVIKDDLTAVGLDYDDLYGIHDNVPAFKILDELQDSLYEYSNAFWQLYTADDDLYKKCLDYLGNKKETLEYLYSYVDKINELNTTIKKKVKQLKNIELGELTDTGNLACDTIYNKIDNITAQYIKLYNKGFPDPDGDGKRGHALADRKLYNQYTLYFDDYDFGLYVGYILHQGAWRQTTIERPGWYNSVLIEDITVVDKEAWDEKVIDYYKCSICKETVATSSL